LSKKKRILVYLPVLYLHYYISGYIKVRPQISVLNSAASSVLLDTAAVFIIRSY